MSIQGTPMEISISNWLKDEYKKGYDEGYLEALKELKDFISESERKIPHELGFMIPHSVLVFKINRMIEDSKS